jgi:hypothetical protein
MERVAKNGAQGRSGEIRKRCGTAAGDGPNDRAPQRELANGNDPTDETEPPRSPATPSDRVTASFPRVKQVRG